MRKQAAVATSPAPKPPTVTPATTGTTKTSPGVTALMWPRSGTMRPLRATAMATAKTEP